MATTQRPNSKRRATVSKTEDGALGLKGGAPSIHPPGSDCNGRVLLHRSEDVWHKRPELGRDGEQLALALNYFIRDRMLTLSSKPHNDLNSKINQSNSAFYKIICG